MRIAEIIAESITTEQIEAIAAIKDIAQARTATLDLMFANASAVQRRADLRQQVQQTGRVKELVQLLWSMKLSNDGLPTGISTSKSQKGVAYR